MDSYDPNDDEDSKVEEYISKSEDDDDSTLQDDDNLEEEAIGVDVIDPCTVCGQVPCVWVSFRESVVRSVMS